MVELRLLNSFDLRCDGEPIGLPMSACRLLAFLALRQHPLLRVRVAGTLWIDLRDERAHANLRSTLWKIHQPGHRLVDATSSTLALAENVWVDLRDAVAHAQHVIEGTADPDLASSGILALRAELLPDWYDDWVFLERERFRQLALHALEARSRRMMECGRYGEAADTALCAISSEPLRESAHRLLVELHLAEGNPSEAIRHFALYRRLLYDQLGIEPSGQLYELVRGLTPR